MVSFSTPGLLLQNSVHDLLVQRILVWLLTCCWYWVCIESGSWFESSSSKSGGMICAKCKTFRCASGAANSEAPPFMFRPVKDEDAAAVSVPDCTVCSLLSIFIYDTVCQ